MPVRSQASDEKSVTEEAAVVPAPAPEIKAQPGTYKLMAFYQVHGKFIAFQPSNPRNVVAVLPEDVEFTVGEQELSADVLNKETSKVIYIPETVANNLDAVRSFVLPE